MKYMINNSHFVSNSKNVGGGVALVQGEAELHRCSKCCLENLNKEITHKYRIEEDWLKLYFQTRVLE